jgi:two-component system, chemotaxis family, sensor histidine kinase and response regulator WspE
MNPNPMTPRSDVSQLSLLDLFCLEVNTQIAMFNHELLNLELTEHRDQSLAALMRSAHSIKGAARIVQVEAGVTIAHHLEDYFVAAQTGQVTPTTDHIDVLLEGGDILLAIAQGLETQQAVLNADSPEIQAYIQALKALLTTTPSITEPSPVLPAAIDDSAITESPQIAPSWESPIALNHSIPEDLPRPHDRDRTVRLSAEHLHHLMDLAGESLVSANGLQHFSQSFLRLKVQQSELNSLLAQVKTAVTGYQPTGYQPTGYQPTGYQQSASSHPTTIQETLTRACQKANECQQMLLDRQSEFELFSQKSNQLADRLYREVVASQMRPFSDIGQGFPRMVRDLAKQLDKQVRLVVLGQTTLVDRDVLDRLEPPLTHLLRNAIDHGIEPPDQRQLNGKLVYGTLHLEASHRAGVLFITVRDDGRGIDPEIIRRSIVQKQLTTAAMAAQMSDPELLEFLYLPGFSTASRITDISGRGVGLDIVRNMLQSVGGNLRTTSQPGQGCTFYLQLPLTLSVIRTLLLQIAGDPYAIPLSRIDRIVTIQADQIIFSENRPYVIDNRQTVGIMSATAILGLPTVTAENSELTMMVIHDRGNCYGLIIDRVLGEQTLVVRPLDKRLGKVPNINTAALLNDGTPLLVIDVDDLLRSLEKQLANGGINPINHIASHTPTTIQKRILVVDDSITVREMERKLLENAGYHVDVAVDGMDGWNAVGMGQYDLMVTDVDMPRLNGIELVRQLKAHKTLQNIPTIIISYKDREVDRIEGLEAGADYYLTKSSFHDDTLLQAVTDLIGPAQP